MKNHIVSQMIIRRFANAINVFDAKTGRIDISKKPSKVFYKHDRLSADLEELLSKSIESRFANLMYGKLNQEHVITLTREELYLIKRYLLMISVRMYSEDEFFQTISNLKNNCEFYLLAHPEYSKLKRNDDLKLSPKELYELALRVYCEHADLNEMFDDPRITLEILCWARPFVDSYLAIWDAPEGMEYLLGDCSMVSEYEGVHELTGGLDLSKISYCFYHLIHCKDKVDKLYYSDTLAKCQIMYENYNIFNLSSTRSLVLINPFFRQYFKQDSMIAGEGKIKTMSKPDVWPSTMQNKELFNIPKNEYKSSIPGMFLLGDLFFYEVKTLTPDELVYVNSLIIRMTHDIFGFNDVRAIKDSVDYAAWEHTNLLNGEFLSLQTKEETIKFMHDLFNAPLMKLSQFCGEPDKDRKSYPITLFNEVAQNMIKDFQENKYIYWYLLFREEQTRNHPNLAFLGNSDERIEYFKVKYEQLWGKPYDK